MVEGKRIPPEMEIARDVTCVGRSIQKETDILRLQDVHTDPVYYSYCEHPNVSLSLTIFKISNLRFSTWLKTSLELLVLAQWQCS